MTSKLRFVLPFLAFLALAALFSSPVFAAKGGNRAEPIIITEVLVRDDDKLAGCGTSNEIIEISGLNFPDWNSEGTDPLVMLGDDPDPLEICGLTPDTILAICPTWVEQPPGINRFECNKDGDFLLSVYTVNSEANYDLTIGAVGPQGPVGPPGPDSATEIVFNLCALYVLTTQPLPPLCINCGNGTLEPLEQCDDGNDISGDGCNAVCESEACGDFKLDVGEECDDGNTIDGDGCSSTCSKECHVPQITAVDPNSFDSSASGERPFSVYGSDFTANSIVYIDGQARTTAWMSSTQLFSALVPSSLTTGNHDLIVNSGPGCSAVLVSAINVY